MHGRPYVRHARYGWVPALLLVVWACGTEPKPEVGGTWSLTSSFAGGDFACTVEALLTLTTDRADLMGTLVEDQATCTSAGEPIEVVTQSHAITGELDGGEVSFRTLVGEGSGDCATMVFEGRASGESTMSGQLETRSIFCQGTFVQMHGTWQAERR
jgi:hypothetical protein